MLNFRKTKENTASMKTSNHLNAIRIENLRRKWSRKLKLHKEKLGLKLEERVKRFYQKIQQNIMRWKIKRKEKIRLSFQKFYKDKTKQNNERQNSRKFPRAEEITFQI